MKILFIILFLFLGINNLYSGSEPFWEEVSAPSTGIVYDMAKDSIGNLYIACENGVWKSTNNGDGWFKFLETNRLPDESNSVRNIDINENNIIAINQEYYSNYLRSISISSDFGKSWEEIDFQKDDYRYVIDIQWHRDKLFFLAYYNSNPKFLGQMYVYDLNSGKCIKYGDSINNRIYGFRVLNDNSIAVRCEDDNHNSIILSLGENRVGWDLVYSTPAYISDLYYYSRDSLFIGTSYGLYRMNSAKEIFSYDNFEDYIVSVNICNGKLILGGKEEVIVFNEDNGSFDHYNSDLDSIIWSRVEDIIYNNGIYFININENGIYKSSDSCKSWESSNNGFSCTHLNRIAFDIIDGSVYLASFGLYKSFDDGKKWDLIGFEGENLHTVYVSKKNDIYISSVVNEAIMKSEDGGKSWKKVLRIRDALFDICENSNGDLFATSLGFAVLYRSFDKGETWERFYMNVGSSGKYIETNSEGHLFISNDYGDFSYSTNNGNSWNIVYDDGSCWYEEGIMFIPNTKYGFVSYGGCLLFTEDNGKRWEVLYDRDKFHIFKVHGYIMAVDSTGMIYTYDIRGPSPLKVIISRTDVWGNYIDDVSEGILDKEINVMAVSPDGYIWSASNYGGVYRSKSPVVGVEEKDLINNNDITISPNPATEILTLSYSVSEPGTVLISLLDMLGRKAIELPEKYTDSGIHKELIDISSLNSGIYFISVKTNSGVMTRKVVVYGK